MSAKAACLCVSPHLILINFYIFFLFLPCGLWQTDPNFNVSSPLCHYRYITDTISLCTIRYYSNLKSYMFRLYEIAVVGLRVSKIHKRKYYISETCSLIMVVSYGRNM